MDLVRHDSSLAIRSIDRRGIRVAENWYREALLITDRGLAPLPEVNSLMDISNSMLEELLKHQPAAIIIGTGARLHRPGREQYLDWLNAGVGVETMDTRAACRTFNILLSEDRPVAAILLPIQRQY